MGLVHQVFPGQELTAGVDDYARRLATTVSPASLAASKRQVYDAMHRASGRRCGRPRPCSTP